jgi:hypothetical protein
MMVGATVGMMVTALVVAGPPRAAFGAAQPCRPWTRGFDIEEQHVEWRTLETFNAVNGTSKETSVTWTVSRSHSRSYEVSGQVDVDSLFDFLKVSVSSKIMRSWTSAVGESLTATMPPHSRAHGVYQVGLQHASGSEWLCDLQGRRQRTPYAASAPAGRRFVRTS